MKILPLTNCNILYTRSDRHMQTNGRKLIELGANVIHLPLIDTKTILVKQQDRQYLRKSDYIIFTSQNAVRHFFEQDLDTGQAKLVCIGKKTSQALEGYAHNAEITAPAPFNSESLLSVWQPKNKNIAIIAAENGREKLKNTLKIGNKVEVIHTYQRYNPSKDTAFDIPNIDVAIISSKETLFNLLENISQDSLKMLQCQALIASLSQRISNILREENFHQILTSDVSDEIRLIKLICEWWQKKE